MINLLTGIQLAFTGNTPLTTAFPNGLEVGLAKDAEALPLCVLTIMPPPAPVFQSPQGQAYIEQIVCQFSAYSTDNNFIMTVEGMLNSVFNNRNITLIGDVCLCSRKNGGGNPYRDDERVWRVDLFYKFWVQGNS